MAPKEHLQGQIQKKILTGHVSKGFDETCEIGKIFKNLLQLEITQGINIDNPLRQLRDFSNQTMKFYKKKRDRSLSSIFQLLSINLFISLYVFIMNTQLGLEMNYFILLSAMSFGGVVIMSALELYTSFLLKDILMFYHEVIKLKVLMSTPKSINEVISHIQQDRIHSIGSKELTLLKDLFFSCLKSYKTQGKCIKLEVDLIGDEISYEIKQRFQRFDENSKTIKMISITLFILPVFLIVNYKVLEKII